MLKKSKSTSYLLDIINKSKKIKFQSCINLSNMIFIQPRKKLISYGEFLEKNPNSTKKQRVNAILNFYNSLLSS